MLKGMFKKTTYINITSEVKKEMDRAGTPQETVEIPASKAPVFKAGQAFKDAIR